MVIGIESFGVIGKSVVKQFVKFVLEFPVFKSKIINEFPAFISNVILRLIINSF